MKLLPAFVFAVATANDDSGATVTCMNGDTVEMTATILKSKVQRDLQEDGWGLADGVYTKTFAASEFTGTDIYEDGSDLVLQKNVAAECVKKTVDNVEVCVATGHTLSFKCKYPLGTQDVSSNFNVAGHDTVASEEGVGELKYSLTVSQNVQIGDKVDVTITPVNANLVYAAVQNCEVVYNSQSVSILDFDSGSNLNQPVCAIGGKVTNGSSKNDLTFEWKAFKWATAQKDAIENQEIRCTISLSKDEPDVKFGNCCQTIKNGVKGKDYRGKVSVTENGRTCQSWSEITPHWHNKAIHEIDGETPTHNYCRSFPTDGQEAWCYTTDPDKRWENCGQIPECE